MNQQLASQGGSMNSLKWAIVIVLAGLGVVGNYHFAEQSVLVRTIGLIVVAALAIATALQTEKGKKFWHFSQDARAELRKVVWPSRKETFQTTALVLAVVAIVGLILWGVDIVLLKVVAWITGYGAS
jgi:preprotein translocase subunit SecE